MLKPIMRGRRGMLVVCGAALLGAWQPARAEITSIELRTVESPAFGGRWFGAVGQYEKLVGTAHGEVDPNAKQNALIADIALAPRNARGRVEYATSVYILRPIHPARGNHELLYEGDNRGNKLIIGALDVFSSATDSIADLNDPKSAGDAGNGWLMRRGYTLAWSGWDPLVPAIHGNMTMAAPVATGPDGKPISGPSLEEFEIDDPTTTVEPLTYAAADPRDTAGAQLTVREHYADPPVAVSGWRYVGAKSIQLAGGVPFTQGRLYQFGYRAVGPVVAGLGFAATRDLIAFLRHGTPALASPLGHDIAHAVSFAISQPGRYFRNFVALGFNRAEDGSQVLDGIDNYIAGGNGIFLNFRFAQPSRTERQHIARWYPEAWFPFAWQDSRDPVTFHSAGRLDACTRTATCPKIIESFSENEYWSKAGSLLTTDPAGQRDLPETPEVRFYQFASQAHAAGTGRGICAQPQNPLLPNAGLRALLVALDAWIRGTASPPDSLVPRLRDGTLAVSLPQSGVRFPDIPGVTYSGIKTIRDSYDFGPRFGAGILDVDPPRYAFGVSPRQASGPGIYPSFVPRDDRDGNNVAGIRLPDVAVPVATFTGWGLQGAAYAAGDGCDASGQMLAFPLTPAAARAAGDPRRSIAERYPNHAAYVNAIRDAAKALEGQRLLLPEDVENYLAAAAASRVGAPELADPEPLAR